jgi:prepilin-type N-terminal cleavage/methylation domain-containing protein
MSIERAPRERGFSLFELMIVMLIIMIVSAVAVPTIMNTVADVRLRSSASTLQGQIQQLRMRAVRDNKPYRGKMTTQAGTVLMYLDIDGDGAYDTNEPTVGLARDVVVTSSGNPSMPTATLNTSGWVSGTPSTDIWFNARGLPCDTSVNAACNTNKGYIYYLSQQRSTSVTAWAAVSITPAGRIKTWRWTGSVWQ